MYMYSYNGASEIQNFMAEQLTRFFFSTKIYIEESE